MNPKPTGWLKTGAPRASVGAFLLAALLSAGCGKQEDATGAQTRPPSAPETEVARSAPAPAPARQQEAQSGGAADDAWNRLEEAFQAPPMPPAEWAVQEPDEEALRAFQRQRAATAVSVADDAKAFYTQFPDDERAAAARWREFQLLQAALQMGDTNVQERLADLEKARLDDPSLSEEERYGIRMGSAQRKAQMRLSEGREEARKSLKESMRELAKDFPARPEAYQVLLSMVAEDEPEEARAVADSVVQGDAPEEVKEMARGLLSRLDLVGKPLSLEFTSLKGDKVSIEGLKGKVVLVDFWATWCGPCIAELPELKSVYEDLHSKGFEILGISFDQDKDELVQFLEAEKITWPQHFEEGRENSLGKRFGIQAIPTVWLVDKKGVVRDLNARSDLRSKVEKLLAEGEAEAGSAAVARPAE